MAALPFVTSVVHYSMGSYTKASNVKVSDRSLNLKGQLKLKHIYISIVWQPGSINVMTLN